MLGDVWRFLVFLFDWKSWIRRLSGKNEIDVVFITNLRDDLDRKRSKGIFSSSVGHFDGVRYWISGTSGRMRIIDVDSEELTTEEGKRKAKDHFISAVFWARKKGAKVVLLAAGTKRLFGKDGAELKYRFPDVLFTNGDNGTAFILQEDVKVALERSNLRPGSSKICIIGPYGILGESILKFLLKSGYDVVGVGRNEEALSGIKERYGIELCRENSHVGKVDAVIACTHSKDVCLTAEDVDILRKERKKLVVVDVAEPSNFNYKEYDKCKNVVVRQDAGNAYSHKLEYVLGPLSYKALRLNKGVTFGCFSESLAVAHALRSGNDSVKDVDWFSVSEDNMELVKDLFSEIYFKAPEPRCFGKHIDSFELSLK